jgi:hypothetical protein
MSDRKPMQLSQNKRLSLPEEEQSRQSYSSLDKIEKKIMPASNYNGHTELSNTFKHKKTNGLMFKAAQ